MHEPTAARAARGRRGALRRRRSWAPAIGLAAALAVLPGATGGAAADAPLADAAERRDQRAVRMLLAESAAVDARQPDGATALHWAAHWNDVDTARLLIAAGADVNAANDLGVTPLALAALNAGAELGAALLRAGADPDAARPGGETVLMTAARTGNPDLVRSLLAAGADVRGTPHFKAQTPLMWAASEGHADVARVLLTAGADVRARSVHGTTALLLAARSGDVETARVLLDAGADVNAAEPYLPIDARVDVEESQTSGRTPLLVASASLAATSGWEYRLDVEPSSHEALALLLLERGADPDVPDSIGRTALHAAVETGRADLVRALLARGADPNARLTRPPLVYKGDYISYGAYVGATPLWLAAAARVPDPDLLRALAAAGGDPRLPAEGGTTPLMAAVGMVQNEARQATASQSLELVTLLLGMHVDVNAVDRRGRTAMHGAARLAKNAIIELLAAHGARVDIADARGQAPLDVGTLSRPLHPDTARLLRSLGATSAVGNPR